METFTVGFGRSRLVHVLVGRNPLVRASDRVEAVMLLLTLLLAVIAIPVAGTVGTAVHESRTQFYAEQAATRQLVTAIAVGDSNVVTRPNSVSFTVRARWRVAGRDQVGSISWGSPLQAGDRLSIWVDDSGRQMGPPPPLSRADGDAVAVGMLAWVGMIVALASVAGAARWLLDRWRYAQWDRETRAWAGDEGGRTNRQS